MDPIPGDRTATIQQSIQIDMLRQSNDSDTAMVAELLSGITAPSPTLAAPSPDGVGALVDRRA